MPGITRRSLTRLLLAAPALPAAALALSGDNPPDGPPRPSPFAACIAATDTSLSADERKRLETALGGLERSLKIVREFPLPADADPAFRFAPLRSRRG